MKIFHKDGIDTIIIDSDIDTQDGFDRLKTFIKEGKSYKIEFLSNITLQQGVVLYLAEIVQNPKYNIKIAIKHPFLSSYFHKLSIKHEKLSSLLTHKKISHELFDVILLSGSAGSYEYIMYILQNLPINKATIVIVQHIGEGSKHLHEIIEIKTPYKATYINDGMVVMPKIVYIAPPNYQSIVEDGVFRLKKMGNVNFAEPSITVTMNSLASHYRDKFCAVLLCGYGADGTTSLKEVTDYGSKVVTIEPSLCHDSYMIVKHAIETGHVSFIFNPNELINYLKERVISEQKEEKIVKEFLDKLYEQYGYDFRDYQIQSLIRRINTCMDKVGIGDYEGFFDEVLNNKSTFTKLFFELSINVTQFIRQPNSYEYLKEHVLPYLNNYSHLKMWCAGVASGEEAYSLATLLDSKKMLEKSIIYATDFNPYILQIAKNGLYPKKQIDDVTLSSIEEINHFKSLFSFLGEIAIVDKKLQKNVHFFTHNLTTDSSIGEFQLIICKNVLIYFNEKLQKKVLRLFYDSLSLDGYLVLGQSETIVDFETKKLFKLISSEAKIYQRA
ncbi:MAG: hypothetical protein HXX81_02345 [Campylobacterales bacterium]|nr:hypothetical protein [Campylobacterales bacterium]